MIKRISWVAFFSALAFTQPIFSAEMDEHFQALYKKAEWGDPNAQYQVALFYRDENAFNTREIVHWLELAALQNYLPAVKLLGLIYTKKETRDDVKATKWYQKAADLNDAEAQYLLGKRLLKGKGINRDPKRAYFWFLKAADQTFCEAYYELGLMYSKGIGVKQNIAKAFHWYHKSAEKNHIQSQLKVGFLHGKGLGTKRDLLKSAYWYEQAALQGDKTGQYKYGMMLAKGKGVEKNLALAQAWLQKSAQNGSKLGDWNAAKLKRKISPEQLAKAQSLVELRLQQKA